MQLIRAINKIIDRKHFTHSKYEEFLQAISKYTVLPLNEFRNYHNDNEVVIGLRHDVDNDFVSAMQMAWIEDKYRIKSTYFILHTADYFNAISSMSLLELEILGFEIGLHQDAMSYICPKSMVHKVINSLRQKGLKISGTSAHGDKAHKNIKFWDNYDKADFGINYEAYELDYNKYYSDCTFINGHRWHLGMLPEFKAGDRVQILIHPEHWHK